MNEQAQRMTKQDRQKWIIILAVGLFAGSIIYSPHRVTRTEEKVDRPFHFGSGVPPAPIVTKQEYNYIQYDFIWDAPRSSSLDFGRLAVTWLGIGMVAALALYLNHVSKDTPPKQV